MSKIYAIHTIALRLLKGEKGDREGKYLVLVESESVEVRNRFSHRLNEASEEAKQFDEAHPEDAKLNEKWDTLVGGFSLFFTDLLR